MDGREWRAGALAEGLCDIYGAAVIASRDEQSAARVTETVVSHAAQAGAFDRRQLVERAIVESMQCAPGPPFASMPPGAREAVALARLAGYSAREIALALDIEVPDAKRLLRAGLDALVPAIETEAQALAS